MKSASVIVFMSALAVLRAFAVPSGGQPAGAETSNHRAFTLPTDLEQPAIFYRPLHRTRVHTASR